MNLILVADNLDNSSAVISAVAASGHQVVKQVGPNDEASQYIEQFGIDGMIVISDEMDRPTLREIRDVIAVKPMPVVVLTRDSAETSIEKAVRTGATVYVVDCNNPDRIGALLQVAKTRFKEQQGVYSELMRTRNALEARKSIEKAKGIIMKQKRLSEEQAYQAIRKLAMDHNRRMGEIASQIIEAAKILV